MGQLHANALRGMADVSSIVVVDTDQDRLAQASASFSTASSLDHLIGKLDAAVIATPPETHPMLATGLLESKVHCLVEKPMALDLESGLHMQLAAVKGRARLAIGQTERFNSNLAQVQRAITSHIDQVDIIRTSRGPDSMLNVDVVLDLMIHDLDWIVEFESRQLQRVEDAQVEWLDRTATHAFFKITFPHRCYSLKAAFNDTTPKRLVTLSGFGAPQQFDLAARQPDLPGDPISRQMAAFVSYCGGEDSGISSGQQALRILNLIETQSCMAQPRSVGTYG